MCILILLQTGVGKYLYVLLRAERGNAAALTALLSRIVNK